MPTSIWLLLIGIPVGLALMVIAYSQVVWAREQQNKLKVLRRHEERLVIEGRVRGHMRQLRESLGDEVYEAVAFPFGKWEESTDCFEVVLTAYGPNCDIFMFGLAPLLGAFEANELSAEARIEALKTYLQRAGQVLASASELLRSPGLVRVHLSEVLGLTRAAGEPLLPHTER
ncbi:MAG: hypothetical protein A2542_00950 [Parcubacteria group bacterium RIFOXYD2_FULL_52_8]|nr:MAG: hypothetical protein A2542_00950 [Parcubacteria group bacterium RIFOXYD2_FULL_52_8]